MWDDLAKFLIKYASEGKSLSKLLGNVDELADIAKLHGIKDIDAVKGIIQHGINDPKIFTSMLGSKAEAEGMLEVYTKIGREGDEFLTTPAGRNILGDLALAADDAGMSSVSKQMTVGFNDTGAGFAVRTAPVEVAPVPELAVLPTPAPSRPLQQLPEIGGPRGRFEPGNSIAAMRPDGSPGAGVFTRLDDNTPVSNAHEWVKKRLNSNLPDDPADLKKLKDKLPEKRKIFDDELTLLKGDKATNSTDISAEMASKNTTERTFQTKLEALESQLETAKLAKPDQPLILGPNGKATSSGTSKTAADVQADITAAQTDIANAKSGYLADMKKHDDTLTDLNIKKADIDETIRTLDKDIESIRGLTSDVKKDIAAKPTAKTTYDPLSETEKVELGNSMAVARKNGEEASAAVKNKTATADEQHFLTIWNSNKDAKAALDTTADNFPNYRDMSLSHQPTKSEKFFYWQKLPDDKDAYLGLKAKTFLRQVENEVAIHRVARSNAALEQLATRVDLHNALIDSGKQGLFASRKGGLIGDRIEIGVFENVNDRNFAKLFEVAKGIETNNMAPDFKRIDLPEGLKEAIEARNPLRANGSDTDKAYAAAIDGLPNQVFRRTDVFPEGKSAGGNSARFIEDAKKDMKVVFEKGFIPRAGGKGVLAIKEGALHPFKSAKTIIGGTFSILGKGLTVAKTTLTIGVLAGAGYVSGFVYDIASTINGPREEGNRFDKWSFGLFDDTPKPLTEKEILEEFSTDKPAPATTAPIPSGGGRGSFDAQPTTPEQGGGGRGSFDAQPTTPPQGGGGRGSFQGNAQTDNNSDKVASKTSKGKVTTPTSEEIIAQTDPETREAIANLAAKVAPEAPKSTVTTPTPEEIIAQTDPAPKGKFADRETKVAPVAPEASKGAQKAPTPEEIIATKADPATRKNFADLAQTNTTDPESFTKAPDSGNDINQGERHV